MADDFKPKGPPEPVIFRLSVSVTRASAASKPPALGSHGE